MDGADQSQTLPPAAFEQSAGEVMGVSPAQMEAMASQEKEMDRIRRRTRNVI